MAGKDLTIGELANRAGLSRSTLLYYDRLGLLRPVARNRGNYRLYSSAEAARLDQIRLYRGMGVPLKEIERLLDDPNGSPAEILQRRLRTLEGEITRMRRQQRSIVNLLKQEPLHEEDEMIDKDRWVAIMKAAGFAEKDMHNWHIQFEKMEPAAHQEFLESLSIDTEEIADIRKWSREG